MYEWFCNNNEKSLSYVESEIIIYHLPDHFYLFATQWFNAIEQWKQDQFVIGTFYDPKIGSKTLEDTAGYAAKIQGVNNAFFNLLSGMDGWYDTSFISYKLGIISKVGIRTRLMDEHSWGKGNATFNQGEANQCFTWLQGLMRKKRVSSMAIIFLRNLV